MSALACTCVPWMRTANKGVKGGEHMYEKGGRERLCVHVYSRGLGRK